MIRLAYEIDAKYEKIYPTQDYGLDLKEMEKLYLGEESVTYPHKLIPNNPKIIRENLRIKELREDQEQNKIPKSAQFETSLFGSKLGEANEGEVSPRKLEKYNQENQIQIQRLKKANEQNEKLTEDYYKAENILKEKTFSRKGLDHFVVEKILGFGPGQIFIKNWVVSRGKGAMKVNKMFRRTILESHRKDYLPRDVIERNKKLGPRMASLGHGVVC